MRLPSSSAVVAALMLGCSAPAPFDNTLKAYVNDGGYVPWSATRSVSVKVEGHVSHALSGVTVPVRVGLTAQTGDAAVKTITIIPSADGAFGETVSLTASEPGIAMAFAELAATSATSNPFIVPTGKLSVGFFERTSSGALAGCVDLEGKAGTLLLDIGGVPTKLRQDSRSCEGVPEKTSVSFVISETDGREVREADGTLPSLTLPMPQDARAFVLLEPASTPNTEGPLPAEGLPMLVRFRVVTSEPVALTPWRASVTPQGDGASEISGATDGQGEASLLLLAPAADALLVRITSGRAERVLRFHR